MTSISQAEYRAMLGAAGQPQAKPTAKGTKYRSRKVTLDGICFDSAKEAKRYTELKLMERAGLICDLRLQVAFHLADSVQLEGEKRKKRAMKYFADFTYFDIQLNTLVVEDVKSQATRKLPIYRVKKHLMKTIHKIDIREV